MKKIADEYWEGVLRAEPRRATFLGDRSKDALMEDVSPEAEVRDRARLEALLAKVRAVSPASLDEKDEVTRSSLELQIRNDLDILDCGLDEWTVDPLEGPQVDLLNMPELQPVKTPEQGRDMVARWRAMGPYLDQIAANLRRGLARGKVATRAAVSKSIEQLDDLLARPLADWPLLAPAKETREDWSAADRARFASDLEAALGDSVRPAFERYRSLLKDEILHRARPPERPGVGEIDPAAYVRMMRVHTSLDLTPERVHATGLEEVARIDAEIAALGKKLFGIDALPALRSRLAHDPKMFFATRDEVAAKAEQALRRAEAVVPRHFGRLPKTRCFVKRIEPHEEKFSTIAYYREPAPDGSRPGSYYINTSAPETRPRYEAEALAFHEAVPGHHTQIAIAQELEGLPEFRKYTGTTAYVEGWALYTEKLADEIGLYGGDLDRLGMLSFDAWRACRLVVDTGLHALGWSRARAIDFMTGHTLLASNNIENEVDRYIVWPAQALAYKTGQLEILALRAAARAKLGSRFDLKGFHDTVLEEGAVALPVLRERVSRWIEATKPEAGSQKPEARGPLL
ncbi:MAG TPA: DUF885 domain-containing protein [Planctomycetota bacterium]|nr:DUF885 domain-containing protein [Planctomycetota bacterium]